MKLSLNLSKFSGNLMNVVASSTDDSQKLQVRIHFAFAGVGKTLSRLDTLSIATMKELSGKDWIALFEPASFASLC